MESGPFVEPNILSLPSRLQGFVGWRAITPRYLTSHLRIDLPDIAGYQSVSVTEARQSSGAQSISHQRACQPGPLRLNIWKFLLKVAGRNGRNERGDCAVLSNRMASSEGRRNIAEGIHDLFKIEQECVNP
jgi:hypothetical protein